VGLLRFDGNSYSRRRIARFITFFHRTNYGKFELLNFNYYCDLFGFRSEDSRVVFRDKLKSALVLQINTFAAKENAPLASLILEFRRTYQST
jgi:hypothetical protein